MKEKLLEALHEKIKTTRKMQMTQRVQEEPHTNSFAECLAWRMGAFHELLDEIEEGKYDA